MSTPLENRPWWNDVVSKLKSRTLRDLAREHGVSVAELQKALERKGLQPKPGGEAAATPAAPSNKAGRPAAEPKGKSSVKAAPAPAATPASAAPAAAKTEGGRANERLEAIRPLLGKISDGDAAEQAGVARKTVVEFRKRHGITRYRSADGGKAGAAPTKAAAAKAAPAKAPPAQAAPAAKAARAGKAAPAAAPTAHEGTGRASKLDAFLDVVGFKPDREVGELSGMTTENVRMYRLRRGIPAAWRVQEAAPAAKAAAAPPAKAAPAPAAKAPAPAPAAKAPAPAPAAKAPAAPAAKAPAAPAAKAPAVAATVAPKAAAAPAAAPAKRGRPRGSTEGGTKVDRALAPYASQIGKVPDADIAARANVSRSAVSAFRQRHAIKASGRGGRPPASAARAKAPVAAAPAPKVVTPSVTAATVAPTPAAAAPAPAARAAAPAPAQAGGGGFVYRVVASHRGETRTFGLVANNAVDAAREAYERLTGRDSAWVIQSIRLLGDALPA